MEQRIKYPIGVQWFSEIRDNGFVYVDKTEYIHKLVTSSKYVFLSRPRRFGKSLLLSTIHEYFAGRRNLFEGLAIAEYEYDWEKYPVLHMDFTGADFNISDSLEATLGNQFNIWDGEFGLSTTNLHVGDRFQNIIRGIAEKTGKKVVILIDEYDKPLLETVDKPHQQERFRNTLRGVYGNLKKMDRYIRFAMLSGVTKFGHLSIFSDLNNLDDISMDEEYAGICGITTDELHKFFHSGVEDLAGKRGKTLDETYGQLRDNYDGYHFSPDRRLDIYNPYSVLKSLSKGKISDYWFQTGTPSFLIKMIHTRQLPLRELNEYRVGTSELMSVSLDLSNFISVLYQSGYLTIKSYDEEMDEVTVGFPNGEVERGFLRNLLPEYTSLNSSTTAFEINSFVRDVRAGDAERFMERLQDLFADFPYDSFNLNELEQHYQDVTYLVMKLMGFITEVEYKTSSGRIDMVVRTDRYIYVFEFKLNGTAKEALEQIDTKNYLLPFRADGRQLVKIGANFSTELRGIDSWIITPKMQ